MRLAPIPDRTTTGAFVSPEIVGRGEELAEIDRFLRGSQGCAFVLDGEAGIGKTTLWLAAIEWARASGWEVLRARPAEVEAAFAFAGLRDLLGALPSQTWQGLPEAQRHALAVALVEDEAGSSTVEPGLLGVAALGVLGTLAGERPLLLAIDDLQWLDEESGAVVVYAFRRLGEQARLLVTCRGRARAPLPFGLQQALDQRPLKRLALEPLSEGAVRRMLRLRLGLDLSRRELRALWEAAGGNPLFALELGRSGIEVDESGGMCLPRNLQDLVGARLRALPATTRAALLSVAALVEPTEDVLRRVGVDTALGPALAEDVIQLEGRRVQFTHPLVRSAVWSSVGEARRREVHRALADAVDDPEQRASHLAAATVSPDAEVAELLEDAAARARQRGAPSAAARLLDRALELTPPGELDRWARLAAGAAVAHAEAGHFDSVQALVEQAHARLPAGCERAAILVAAAEMRPGLDDLFRQAVTEAGATPVGVRAHIGLTEQAGLAGRWREGVETARSTVSLARQLGDRSLLGVALTWLGGLKYLDSQPGDSRELGEALALERELGRLPTSVFESPQMWQGAALLWRDDPDGARVRLTERLAAAAERGDDMSTLQTMRLLSQIELRAGNWRKAREIARTALEQVELLGYEYGRPVMLGALAAVDACEGELERARALGTKSAADLAGFGDRLWSTYALATLLFTELCAGNAPAAVAQAAAIADRFPDGRECWWSYHQGDEIEALVRAGELERARGRVEALRRAGDQLRLPRFLAWAERGEGHIHAAGGNLLAAEAALEMALAHHEHFPIAFERARTLLALGHVLRRSKRRHAARTALGEALAEFERLGADHFAETTRAELKHVGGRAPAGEELTEAEERVARLVASGLSNKEAAAELFVAVSTVEATLTHVYRKLGVRSRSQLARAYASGPRRA